MGKLNGVKTVDMVNGEITKIAYEGAEYAKVANDFHDAQTGDLFLNTENGGFYEITIRASDFYGVPHPVRFMNDKGRESGYMRECNVHPLFRKISVQSKPTLEQRVGALERDVAALKGEKVAEETIEFEGATYRKVEREAREGDVVIMKGRTESLVIKTDVPYKMVTDSQVDSGTKYGTRPLYDPCFGRTRETVDVYEPIEQAKYVPREGDIVVITGNTSVHANKIGDIGKVGKGEPLGDGGVNVYVPEGPTNAIRTKPQDIRKASPAEVEKYEQALHKASFAVGDYVRVVKSYRNLEGNIAKITQIGEFRSDYGVAEFEIEHLTGEYAGKTLVANADQIVKATYAEIAKATAPKLKAGDYVKITLKRSWYTPEKVYEVIEHGGTLRVIDDVGDANGEALRMGEYEIVDAETAKWAKIGRKPNEFKKGDVVRVVERLSSDFTVGTIGIVEKDEIDDCRRPTTLAITTDGKLKSYHPRVELVAPVESVFK
ncbi:hypothetical protein 8F11_22 [uncultured Caudovirales phage]|uniref:Uncharacterized protein n=1 Tax=uncultured Caudovirales phage TaxID=2100421 RepID=A0A2H4J459_9CAUD|nr:hypothetical protein 8F11_22 [uncultured Caudovirales phage]